jgi:hypothetical protein
MELQNCFGSDVKGIIPKFTIERLRVLKRTEFPIDLDSVR